MGPTRSVPAALHSELSEYASLLRAIRTKHALDIVPQLSRPDPVFRDSDVESRESFESEEDGNPGYRSPDSQEETPGRSKPTKGKAKAKAKGSAQRPKKSRRKRVDVWTRWPLLQEHCPIPEWGLDEEVMAIAQQCSRSRSPSTPVAGPSTPDSPRSLPSTDGRGDELDYNDPSATHLSGLTSDAASKLSEMLALLASHRPSATYTKHGRVDPMGWEDVLEVVGIGNIFKEEVVEEVKQRMEVIFGPSQSQVVHRMQVLAASKRTLMKAEASYSEEIPSPIEPLSGSRSRRSRNKRKHTTKLGSEDGSVDTMNRANTGRPTFSGDHANESMDVDHPS